MNAPAGFVAAGSRRAALAGVLAVLFLTFLDTTIVSVTLGDLEGDISAGVIPLQWVLNAYSLVFASLMLVGGALADRWGRQRMMLAGIAVFCVGSTMCALAGGVATIIAGRAVMGLGAALSEPGTLSIIRQLFPDRRGRARALGAWSAVSGLALALGPVVGGLLVGAGDWRSVFWFNLALGAVLLLVVWGWVPDSRDPQPGRLDLAGFGVATAGIFGVVYAGIAGEYRGYRSADVLAILAAGLACLIAFAVIETHARAPMLDPRHVRSPVVRAALFAAFAVYFGVFAIFFLTALYLDVGLQYSGWKLAAMFAPMAAAIVVGGALAGSWVARRGARRPMAAGCAVAAVGMVLARVELGDRSVSFPLLALALALAGLGFGVTVVPLTSAVLAHIPARHSGVAASLTNTARQLGAVAGVAALGAVVNAHLRDEVDRTFGSPLLAGPREDVLRILETGGSARAFDINRIPANFIAAFRDGLQVSLVVATVLVVLAGVVAAAVREPPPGEDDALSRPGPPPRQPGRRLRPPRAPAPRSG